MIARLEVSGGFGGLRLPAIEVDSDALPAEQARRMLALAAAARVAESRPAAAAGAADLMGYRIELVDDGDEWSGEYDDKTLPPEAAELVTFLREAAAR